ncbi:prepilin peptidase [Methylophaga sp. OBS4]|uniref:prepilin peptidase n=1 Tax=Methylophaga sp. OBS4 TaxID=2991935 RepID=UPI00225B2CD4|nr:A24 family peptidase [Methylophaga sp. OBS4]MCX4188415.1 A24 family peptidase [Methylophaga sp. OBS4]
MQLIEFLSSSPGVWVTTAVILGLLVGSFLNVVIYRLPLMMQREWEMQCAELAGETAMVPVAPFNLSTPRSRCPHCDHAIAAAENIPVISYLLLGGKCKVCRQPISKRYPLIEALTGLMSGIIAWKFGFDWAGLGALLLTWSLIALTFIDIDQQLLPDKITLPLVWLGLFFNLSSTYTALSSSVVGAIAGYLSLWLVYHLFRLITGKEGMGYGDFKLLAALGAWLGWQYLPMIVLLSSLVGAVVGITLVMLKNHQREVPIPFGPYLAAAGWIALVWGAEINQLYLSWAGLS